MLNNSSKLSDISFNHMSNVGLVLIASHCGASLWYIDANVERESSKAIQSLCQACPKLRAISLWNDSFDMDGDEIIQTIVQCCPFIQLMSTFSWRLSDTSLNALASIHTLKQLQLAYGHTNAAVQPLLRANPDLVSLSLTVVDDALVRCIGRCCGHLERLKLGDVDHPAYCSSALMELFCGCPLLESFHLHQHGGMSNAALRALFEHCHGLTELQLVFKQPTVPSLIAEPVLYVPFPTLTKLWVANHGLPISALRDIFTYCTNLREVCLTCCKQVSDEILITLVQNCKSLDTLCLASCKIVTIAGLVAVPTYCTSLRVLVLIYMSVNDKILLELSLNCRSLTRLSLLHCTSGPLTEAGVLTVLEGCTGLTLLAIHCSEPDSITPTLNLAKLKELYPHITFDITGM